MQEDDECSICGYSLDNEHCEQCGECSDGDQLCEDCEYEEDEGEE